jgi:LuxR family maltose regulon positive regulatory protein
MPTPILATKLYIPPPRPKIVFRSRLVEQLNEGLQRSPGVTLISAPAGFGKTTLISEWLVSCKRPAAWLSLDEGDNELTRFLTYLVAALQTMAPKIGERVLEDLQSAQPPPTAALLTTLLNEITILSDNFILVLDDYHVIDSQPVDQALAFLVEHLPPQMHLVIASREDPPIPLARLRVRGQLIELRAADLRFTPTEAAEFLNRVMGLNLSAEDIAALENRTEGWIAGLQLAALALQGTTSTPGQQDATRFIESFTGSHHFVLDYLLEEVLQKQSENIQSFLLGTAILDRLCGPLCEALLLAPATSGQETLEYLERANLFIVPLDNERRWYRYHRLFADLLQQRLRQATSNVAEYHVRASQWHADNGFVSEAFHHAMAARDFGRAANVAERAWQSMDGSFRSAAWLGWIKQLPEEVIRVRPVLCTQIGTAFMDAGEPEASESYLREAERLLKLSPEEMIVVEQALFASLPAMIALDRAYNAQVQGDLSVTVSYAELALQLIAADDVYRRAQATVMLIFTHWANGNLAAVLQMMNDWMNSMQQLGNIVFVVASAFAVADILVAQGRLREAVRTYQQSLQLAADHGPEAQSITAHHHLGLALLYREMQNDAAVGPHLQKAQELGEQTTLVDWPYRWRLAQARLKQDEGDLDAALDLLDEAKRVYVKNPVPDLRPIEALKAQVYLRQGRLGQAQVWVRERGLSTGDEINYLHEFEYITLARVLMAEGSNQPAGELLERLRQAAEAQDRLGSVIEILIVQALACQAQGNTPAALASLERALTLAEPEGYVRIFVDVGEPMRLLMVEYRLWIEKQAREAHKPIGYVDKLLAAFAQTAAIPQSTVSHPPSALIEPLSQRELEILRLIAQGLSNAEISQRLFLALSTIKGHNLKIFGKLQVQNRTEAVARARELGLL